MNSTNVSTHRKVQHSTTLNRKYVKQPAKANSAIDISQTSSIASTRAENLKRRQELADQINRARLQKIQTKSVTSTSSQLKTQSHVPKPEPKTNFEPKIQKFQSSLVKPATNTPIKTVSEQPKSTSNTISNTIQKNTTKPQPKQTAQDFKLSSTLKDVKKETKNKKQKTKKFQTKKIGFGRIALAMGCALVAAGSIAYIVSISKTVPDFSLQVAAMQTNVDISYPTYIPRDYSLDEVVTEPNKVTMTFKNANQNSFTITEETSSWDSTTLEKKYVKQTLKKYSSIKEQGLTLYMNDNTCIWVNGGKIFTIESNSNTLSKKQFKSIAVSL